MILLSFDIEEFDMPYEYGKEIAFDEQLAISNEGTLKILAILSKHNIKATFYCTATFALNRRDIIAKIIDEGHELASHGYYHSDFKPEHLKQSKDVLEEISGQPIKGYRMARMMPVDENEIWKAGYQYNSSINPTFLPGRYNNFDKPRTWFFQDGVLQLPSSVSPFIRFPLFWLSFHNLPLGILKWLSKITHRKDGYLNLYFHPWEFTDLKQPEKFGFPNYVTKNTGVDFEKRIDSFIGWAKEKGYEFEKSGDFVNHITDHSLDTGILFEDSNQFLYWNQPIDQLAKVFKAKKNGLGDRTIYNWGTHTILNGLKLDLTNSFLGFGEEQKNKFFNKIEYWTIGDESALEKFDTISRHLITQFGEPSEKDENREPERMWKWNIGKIVFSLYLFEQHCFKLHFTIQLKSTNI